MIENKRRQYVTRSQIEVLQRALAIARADRLQMDQRVYEAMVGGIQSHIDEMRAQLRAGNDDATPTPSAMGD